MRLRSHFSSVSSPRIEDDMFARVLSPIIEEVPHKPRRRDALLVPVGQTLYADPSARIWDLYLSQAAKSDKELSDSVRSNADQLLVFVRQTLKATLLG